MSIIEFIELCTDPSMLQIDIWDGLEEKIVWSGYAEDIPEQYADEEVSSFDLPEKDKLTINIH